MPVVYLIISCTALDDTTKSLFWICQIATHSVVILATSDISPHKYEAKWWFLICLIAVSSHADVLILLQAMPLGLMSMLCSSLCRAPPYRFNYIKCSTSQYIDSNSHIYLYCSKCHSAAAKHMPLLSKKKKALSIFSLIIFIPAVVLVVHLGCEYNWPRWERGNRWKCARQRNLRAREEKRRKAALREHVCGCSVTIFGNSTWWELHLY